MGSNVANSTLDVEVEWIITHEHICAHIILLRWPWADEEVPFAFMLNNEWGLCSLASATLSSSRECDFSFAPALQVGARAVQNNMISTIRLARATILHHPLIADANDEWIPSFIAIAE
jgi:hypothetical protein